MDITEVPSPCAETPVSQVHSIDHEIRCWSEAVAHNRNCLYTYSLYVSYRRKYTPHISPSILFDLYFILLYYGLRPLTRKFEEWGAEGVDWQPFASKDDIMMLEPYKERVAFYDHDVCVFRISLLAYCSI